MTTLFEMIDDAARSYRFRHGVKQLPDEFKTMFEPRRKNRWRRCSVCKRAVRDGFWHTPVDFQTCQEVRSASY